MANQTGVSSGKSPFFETRSHHHCGASICNGSLDHSGMRVHFGKSRITAFFRESGKTEMHFFVNKGPVSFGGLGAIRSAGIPCDECFSKTCRFSDVFSSKNLSH